VTVQGRKVTFSAPWATDPIQVHVDRQSGDAWGEVLSFRLTPRKSTVTRTLDAGSYRASAFVARDGTRLGETTFTVTSPR
jgi:hypothetical protein